jgi:hypothetical protein
VLLNLRRDEDAIAFIRYWFKWRPPGPGQLRDPLALLSKRGESPFPVERDCDLLDITDELRDAEFSTRRLFLSLLPVEEMEVPFPFCFVALVIKRHHICVHCIRREHADAFVQLLLTYCQRTS